MPDMQEVLDRILKSFSSYYDVNTETPANPFVAEAVFSTKDEQYFLIKSAKLSESYSSEYVFFAHTDMLDENKLDELDEKAWLEGLKRADVKENHKSTDVVLVILAEFFEKDIENKIKKKKHYKSYRFGLLGWSAYRLVAYELSSGKTFSNGRGEDLKKLFCNIN